MLSRDRIPTVLYDTRLDAVTDAARRFVKISDFVKDAHNLKLETHVHVHF